MSKSIMTRTTPLIASVCYVRQTVSEPQACARFVSDIFGLQQVADHNGELAFRSDDRYRTLSLSGDPDDGASIGIEAWDEDEVPSSAEHHLARLDALVTPVPSAQFSSTLATDTGQLAEMVDAAGPVRAWTGDEQQPG